VITTTPTPPFAGPFRIMRTVTSVGVTDAYAFPSITPTQATGGSPLVNSSGHGDWGVLDHGLYSVTVKQFVLQRFRDYCSFAQRHYHHHQSRPYPGDQDHREASSVPAVVWLVQKSTRSAGPRK
jgi:hypothetical protein